MNNPYDDHQKNPFGPSRLTSEELRKLAEMNLEDLFYDVTVTNKKTGHETKIKMPYLSKIKACSN